MTLTAPIRRTDQPAPARRGIWPAALVSLGLHAAALAMALPWLHGPAQRPGIASVSVTLVPGAVLEAAETAGGDPHVGREAMAELETAAAPPEPASAPPAPRGPAGRSEDAPASDLPPAPTLVRQAPPAPEPEGADFALAQVALNADLLEPPPAPSSAAPGSTPAPPERPERVATQPAPPQSRTGPSVPTPAEVQPQQDEAEATPATTPQKAAPAREAVPSGDAAPAATADALLSRLPAAPAPSTGTSSRASAAAPAGGALRERYAAQLLRHVERYKRYPDQARRLRLRGAVRLTVTLDRAGRLISSAIAEPSPHEPLNAEAAAVARRAAPYPSMPDGLGQNFTFTVTLRFEP